MTRDEYEEILKAALINLHTGQLLNANGLVGAAQLERLRLDFDMLASLKHAAETVAAEKLKE